MPLISRSLVYPFLVDKAHICSDMYSSLNPSRELKGGWPQGCGWWVSSNPIRVIPVGDRFQHPYVSDSAHGTSGWLLFSCSVVSDSLWPHGLHHARLSHPSLSPGVCSDSCHRVCHPTISSSSPFALNLSQHQGVFHSVSSLHQMAKVLELQLQQ